MAEIRSEKDIESKVYEIGYLLVSSVPVEKVTDIVTHFKDVLSKKGSNMISEEAPELRDLAYTMIKKIGTSNQRFEKGYFGWFKFELPTKEIEEVKKTFEMHPDMLRMLVITTVRENTYLGKKSTAVASITGSAEMSPIDIPTTESLPIPVLDEKIDDKIGDKVAGASIEEMDKSIDEMVKGA